MLSTYANNIYLLERLDYYCDGNTIILKFAPHLLMLCYCMAVRNSATNLYTVLTCVMLFFEFSPTFNWKTLPNGEKSKVLVAQGSALRYVLRFCIVLMTAVNVVKGLLLFLFLLSRDLSMQSGYLGIVTNPAQGATDKEKLLSVFREGGITLIAESLLCILIGNTVRRYRPIVLEARDVIFYKTRMEFWMKFITPTFEILVFGVVAYIRTFFGFVLAFFTCIFTFAQIPSFDRHYNIKIMAFSMMNIICFILFSGTVYLGTPDPGSYMKNTLNLTARQVRQQLGAYIPYTLNNFLNSYFLDQTKLDINFAFSIGLLFFSFTSGLILYHVRIGSLAENEFKEAIVKAMELPTSTTFKDTDPDMEALMKDSYYINYFIKKISLIFELNIEEAINEKNELSVDYIREIPYIDQPALVKKIHLYLGFQKRGELESKQAAAKQAIVGVWDFIIETATNVLTLSNIVYSSLFGYVAFFFYFVNQNPSFWALFAFAGVFLLGMISFRNFIFYSQFLVGVPMIMAFLQFYFANLPIDIIKCENSNDLFCQGWSGMINRRRDLMTEPDQLFIETLVKIGLFQGLFFFYRMLKFTDELFVEKSDKELNLEIEESFNRGSLPFIRIVIIQISSNFYIICFILMLYIGTTKTTYTNISFLIMAIVFMSKFKMVTKRWNIIYIGMNIILLLALLIELVLNTSQKVQYERLLNLVGLPINAIGFNAQKIGGLRAMTPDQISNKILVILLYICCLVQQLGVKNRYLKCYLIKLEKIKQDSWLVQNVNNWKQMLKDMIIKIYYRGGVWISYFLNIYLPLFQSITIFRALLLISIIVTFIVHINAMRVAKSKGKVLLNQTYFYWKVFLVLKTLNLCLLVVGAFGLTELVRDYLSIVKDSEDYEIINYIGMESLEPEIMKIIPILQNCSKNLSISTNKLRFYFVAECITFVMTKIAMKIINIQKIYYNNLHGVITDSAGYLQLKENKPRMFKVFKVFHKYIIGTQLTKSKKANKFINSLTGFLARVYTSVIYFITLTISVLRNISLLMLVQLYFFLRYFIEMNKIFLDYLTKEEVEKIVKLKLEIYHENYISESALMHEVGTNQRILKDENLGDKDLNKDPAFTNEFVRKGAKTDLFALALKLRIKITEYDKDNKYTLFLVSLITTTSILLLTYFNALLQNIFSNNLKVAVFIKWLKIISTIFGFKYYRNEATCLADELLPFIGLFMMLAYDVYVIQIIHTLQKDLQRKIEIIDKKDVEFRKETLKPAEENMRELTQKEIDDYEHETNKGKKGNKKTSSDDEAEEEEDFQDIFQLELGADEKEMVLEKMDLAAMEADELAKNKDIELALLDDKDRQEVKIRALRIGDEESLKKYTDYDALEDLDLHRWNFYEFYIIGKNKGEKDFRSHMLELRKFKNKNEEESSDSENQDDTDDSDEIFDPNADKDKLKNKYPCMQERKNILIYFYQNVKKYTFMKILKFFLDILQRFIGAIFIMIVLQKASPLVVILYWLFIIYFYYAEHNAVQLQRTSIFMSAITLFQYSVILLQQKIPNQKPNGTEEQVMLVDYIWFLINNEDSTIAKLSQTFDFPFKFIGILSLNQLSLLYDSIPTVLFQVTMFYYDFFLLYCAENIETIFLKFKKVIFNCQNDPTGRVEHIIMINHKLWKDFLTSTYLSIQSFCTVRLIEIMTIILLTLNIFYPSPIWNFFRLSILFFFYAKVAFRTIDDSKQVRERLTTILTFAVVYLWARVVISTAIDCYDVLKPNTDYDKTIKLLYISSGEKLILVLEFFLVEYIRSVYFDKDFIEFTEKIIEKKIVRAKLIAVCMTYNHNEEKLMKYIDGFKERIELEEDIHKLQQIIDEWKKGEKRSQQIKSHINLEEEEQEQKNKEGLQKLDQTSSAQSKLIFQIYQTLINLRNGYLFQNVLALYDYILQRNIKIVKNKEIDIRKYLYGDFSVISANLDHIKRVYDTYTEDAIRQEYNTVELRDVLKKSEISMEVKETLRSISNIGEQSYLTDPVRLRHRKKRPFGVLPSAAMEGLIPESSIIKTQNEAIKQYDFKVIRLNTIVEGVTDLEPTHAFYNMLVKEYEDTRNYQQLNVEVITSLVFQVIISNWHYICYGTMIIYTFVNGGLTGFFYTSALLCFVLVEENLPGVIFWKMCFINTAIGFSMKLLLTVFAEKLVEVGLMSSSLKLYINNLSFLIIGSSPYIFEIIIMIFILIELIIADELGFKKAKMTDFEDANSAYIRMKINNIFVLKDQESFHKHRLYLKALHQSIKDIDQDPEEKKKLIKASLKINKKSKKKNVLEDDMEKDEIDIDAVITYEQKEYEKKTKSVLSTIKEIEKNIFIKGFGRFSEENMRSFTWQLFSVYVT
jgi:hypothetical protein